MRKLILLILISGFCSSLSGMRRDTRRQCPPMGNVGNMGNYDNNSNTIHQNLDAQQQLEELMEQQRIRQDREFIQGRDRMVQRMEQQEEQRQLQLRPRHRCFNLNNCRVESNPIFPQQMQRNRSRRHFFNI